MAKCLGKRPNGEGCKGDAMPGAMHCWAHDPANAEQRQRKASKGGKRGGKGRPGANAELQELKTKLKAMLGGVLSGRILPGIASVANQIQNSRLRAVEVERKLKETEDLEARLEALEAQLSEQGIGTNRRDGYGIR